MPAKLAKKSIRRASYITKLARLEVLHVTSQKNKPWLTLPFPTPPILPSHHTTITPRPASQTFPSPLSTYQTTRIPALDAHIVISMSTAYLYGWQEILSNRAKHKRSYRTPHFPALLFFPKVSADAFSSTQHYTAKSSLPRPIDASFYPSSLRFTSAKDLFC